MKLRRISEIYNKVEITQEMVDALAQVNLHINIHSKHSSSNAEILQEVKEAPTPSAQE